MLLSFVQSFTTCGGLLTPVVLLLVDGKGCVTALCVVSTDCVTVSVRCVTMSIDCVMMSSWCVIVMPGFATIATFECAREQDVLPPCEQLTVE